jgi:hypothetical protein
MPTVSIGVPVFNGEQYLAQALDSILAQTYTDFEVLIADNSSTDKTAPGERLACYMQLVLWFDKTWNWARRTAARVASLP